MVGITKTRVPDSFEAQIAPAARALEAQIRAYGDGLIQEPPRQIGDAEARYMAATAGLTDEEMRIALESINYVRRENGYSYVPPEQPTETGGGGGGNRSFIGYGRGGGGGGGGYGGYGGGGGYGGFGGWANQQGLPELSRFGRVFDPAQFGLISWRF
jgi:hypothetical protein